MNIAAMFRTSLYYAVLAELSEKSELFPDLGEEIAPSGEVFPGISEAVEVVPPFLGDVLGDQLTRAVIREVRATVPLSQADSAESARACLNGVVFAKHAKRFAVGLGDVRVASVGECESHIHCSFSLLSINCNDIREPRGLLEAFHMIR